MTINYPWLRISARDYEAHMAEIGQSVALREIFSKAYANHRPRRLLILGCTTGADFDAIDPSVTEQSVAVDLNRDYLEIARARPARLFANVALIHGDVLELDFNNPGFDLIYAALILEYVAPDRLFSRMAKWLAPGGICVTVTQNPTVGVSSISQTRLESLALLDGHMTLHEPERLKRTALRAGLERTSSAEVALPLGKSFTVAIYRGLTLLEHGNG